MADWVTKEESLSKYGKEDYTGWGKVEAEADFQAKGGVKGTSYSAGYPTPSVSNLNFEDLFKQTQGILQKAYAPQYAALEAQKPGIETRYENLLDEITRETYGAKSAEYGRRGIPLSSGAYETDIARTIAPLKAQAGEIRESAYTDLTNALAALQSGQITGGLDTALSLMGYQQQAKSAQDQLNLAYKQLEQNKELAQLPETQQQYATLSQGQTLYDILSGKPLYTVPKTYAPSSDEWS